MLGSLIHFREFIKKTEVIIDYLINLSPSDFTVLFVVFGKLS